MTERGSNPCPGSVGPVVTPVPQECGPLPARLALIPAGSGMCGDSCACARLTSSPAGKRCRGQGLLLRGERGGKEPVLPLTLRLPAGPGSAGSRGGERGHSCTQIPVLGQRCGPAPSVQAERTPQPSWITESLRCSPLQLPKIQLRALFSQPQVPAAGASEQGMPRGGGREGWEAAPAGCRRREARSCSRCPRLLLLCSSALRGCCCSGVTHQQWAKPGPRLGWLCLEKDFGVRGLCRHPLLHPAANSPLPVPPRRLHICSSAARCAEKGFVRLHTTELLPAWTLGCHWESPGLEWKGS